MKKCPFCAEDIQDEAIKCRYCGSDLSPAATRVKSKRKPSKPSLPDAVAQPIESRSAAAGQQPEETLLESRTHWGVFLRPALWLVLAAWCASQRSALTGFMLLTAIIDGISRFMLRSNTRHTVTTRRLIMSTGIFKKHSLEIPLPKIESIAVTEDSFGRLLGYGTIVVGGSGGTKEVFPMVPGPQNFRASVQKRL